MKSWEGIVVGRHKSLPCYSKITGKLRENSKTRIANPLIFNVLAILWVGIADEISNIKFIEDFDKIVNFMLATSHA